LKKRWTKSISVGGDYVEKWQNNMCIFRLLTVSSYELRTFWTPLVCITHCTSGPNVLLFSGERKIQGSKSSLPFLLRGTKVFRSRERKLAGAKVPCVFTTWSERSLLGTFAPGSESTEERKGPFASTLAYYILPSICYIISQFTYRCQVIWHFTSYHLHLYQQQYFNRQVAMFGDFRDRNLYLYFILFCSIHDNYFLCIKMHFCRPFVISCSYSDGKH